MSTLHVRSAAVVHRDVMALADPQRAAALQRFFKTQPGEYAAGDRFLGLTVPAVRRVASTYAELPLRETKRLLTSKWHEERLLALVILVRQYQRGDARQRAAIYRCYIGHRRHINNWDLVDLSAPQIVGAHLTGRGRSFLMRLAASRSVWDRRIAVLATFHRIKAGDFDASLAVAARLLNDPHDLIHKAVGWMLREIGKRDRRVEDRFLAAYGDRMPPTMLRYAIEHYPEPVRARHLARRRAARAKLIHRHSGRHLS